MPKVAKAEPNSRIAYGDHVFEFGDDGTRQVSEAEAEVLARYEANGGPLKVEITEATKSKRKE